MILCRQRRLHLATLLPALLQSSPFAAAFSNPVPPVLHSGHNNKARTDVWRLQDTTRTVIDDEEKTERVRSILRVLTLVDQASDEILAQGFELQPFPEERDKPDEDELEVLYPTQRQYFQFDPKMTVRTTDSFEKSLDELSMAPVQQVRTTSFGCSKMGHQVWPSGIALCLSLVHDYGGNTDKADSQQPTLLSRTFELGSGCGLPSIVCRDVLKVPNVVATDFWYSHESQSETRDLGRLVPESWHGQNLEHNLLVERNNQNVTVHPVDWHDLDSVRKAATASAAGSGVDVGIDLVIGSDLIYYFMDLYPLWKTLDTLLTEVNAGKVVLMSPLDLETREALPTFLELLDEKATAGYQVDRQELVLYRSLEALEERSDGDRFLKMTISKAAS